MRNVGFILSAIGLRSRLKPLLLRLSAFRALAREGSGQGHGLVHGHEKEQNLEIIAMR